MNPSEIANFLSRDDVIFLINELIKKIENKTELAEKLKIERKTLYNLPTTKDISIETKHKIVRFYISNNWHRLYSFLESNLAAKYCDVLMDILQAKWSDFNASDLEFQKKNIMYDIIDYLEKFDTILKENCPDRLAPFMEMISNYVTGSIVPRKQLT